MYGTSVTGTGGEFSLRQRASASARTRTVKMPCSRLNAGGLWRRHSRVQYRNNWPRAGRGLSARAHQYQRQRDVFNVDGSGDMYYKGALIHTAATARGEKTVRSFSPNSTQADRRRLGDGATRPGCRRPFGLDPAFRRVRSKPGAAYRVFPHAGRRHARAVRRRQVPPPASSFGSRRAAVRRCRSTIVFSPQRSVARESIWQSLAPAARGRARTARPRAGRADTESSLDSERASRDEARLLHRINRTRTGEGLSARAATIEMATKEYVANGVSEWCIAPLERQVR